MSGSVVVNERGWGLRRVPPELERRWVAEGYWDDRTLGDLVTAAVEAQPDQSVSFFSQLRPTERTTYAGMLDEARRLAGSLAARGIGPGDVVALQLPNWREGVATIWAASLLGAVIVPIVHYYGRLEVDFILERSQARAFVTTTRFGRLKPLSQFALRPALADLDLLVVVGKNGPRGTLAYDDLLTTEPWTARADVDPAGPAVVAYTSGTTSEPKGVIHSHRGLLAEMVTLNTMLPTDLPKLTPSPIGHVSGMLTGALAAFVQGVRVSFIDQWDPGYVLSLMASEGLAAGSGATYFLTSLLDHPDLTPEHLALMKHVTLGGAPVPESVAARATSLGISVTRNYGSTEQPTITGSLHSYRVEAKTTTDGRPMPGIELRLVDDDGNEVAVGEPGEILSRGPDLCIGFTDPAWTARAIDDDGWYHTEDVGVLDAEGFLTITDRKKDVIIRGGENISALEVEEILSRHPAVAEAAVVAAPDERLGEHPCAFVRLRDPSASVTLAELREHAGAQGLGRQKWPEERRLVTDFPRTASGKIKKRDLRSELG